jgi:hypothetical protein
MVFRTPRVLGKKLLLADGADGTYLRTGAAIGTFSRIDYIMVRTFANSADWAFSLAGAATNAIVADFITHFLRHLLSHI